MHGGLSPACLPGTVFTHKGYHRFWLVDSSALASILTQYILRVSSDFWFVGSGFYMISFHYIIIVVVGWGGVSLCLCEAVAYVWFVVTVPNDGWVPLKHWYIGLMLIDSGKWNFKERNVSPIHHKFHTNCCGIDAGSPQWQAGD